MKPKQMLVESELFYYMRNRHKAKFKSFSSKKYVAWSCNTISHET